MYVCLCNKVTDSDIRHAVESGANSMKKLQKSLGVANNCGTCIGMAKSLLKESLEEQLLANPDIYYAA